MVITKKIVADKIIYYLQHKITLVELVDWAEDSIMDGEFDEKDFNLINDIVGNLGLADVKAFGLLWVDCEDYLKKLGYKIRVEAHSDI